MIVISKFPKKRETTSEKKFNDELSSEKIPKNISEGTHTSEKRSEKISDIISSEKRITVELFKDTQN